MNLSERLEETISFFIFVFTELTILFLLISFFVELINHYVDPNKIRALLSSKKKGYLTATMLGAISPFCSCSTIPFTIGLLKAKAGFGPVMTFLFTSPILSPIMITLFVITFGWKITLLYSLIAISAALTSGYILEKYKFDRFVKYDVIFDDCCDSKPKFSASAASVSTLSPNGVIAISSNQNNTGFSSKGNEQKVIEAKKTVMIKIAKKTFKQFVSFIPYFAIGIGIGAVIHGYVPADMVSEYANKDNIFAVPFSAILGIPLYMRAATMIGIAPELLTSGVSMGALLALTVGATGASIPEVILLKRIFKWQLILFFLGSVFLMAIGCGYLINTFF